MEPLPFVPPFIMSGCFFIIAMHFWFFIIALSDIPWHFFIIVVSLLDIERLAAYVGSITNVSKAMLKPAVSKFLI